MPPPAHLNAVLYTYLYVRICTLVMFIIYIMVNRKYVNTYFCLLSGMPLNFRLFAVSKLSKGTYVHQLDFYFVNYVTS